MSVEAMKQALGALALFASDESDEGQVAIAAHEELRQAIEQAEKDEADFQDFVAQLQEVEKEACEIIRSSQEPVAWGMVRDGEICDCITPAEHDREQGEYTVPLYATPPEREWIGLTDHDIHQLRQQGAHSVSDKEFRMIEAKLKEKNT